MGGSLLLLLLFTNMKRTALLCIKYRSRCNLLEIATRWRRICLQRGCSDLSRRSRLQEWMKTQTNRGAVERRNFCVFRESNVFPNSVVRSPDHIRCPGMELNISNKLLSPASLSIKMPPCYRGLSPTHSHIKTPHLPPDDPNPPIHLQPHRQILRELPCTSEPSHL
jgi:hypothetical protein